MLAYLGQMSLTYVVQLFMSRQQLGSLEPASLRLSLYYSLLLSCRLLELLDLESA